MKRSGLSLAQLRVIDALARTGSIQATATALGIAQPSVTKHLTTIEGRYRQRLFERRGRQLIAAEACEALLPRIRTLLALAEEIESDLEGLRGLKEGRLRIGYSTHQFVMHVLGGFMDSFRGIKIEARCMASFDLLAQLRAGVLDAAFVTLPSAESDLAMIELRREALVLMTGTDHPLAARTSVHLSEISDWPLIQREGTSGTRRALEAMAVRDGVKLNAVLELGSWESLRDAVLRGIGVGVVMAGEIGGDVQMRAIPIDSAKGQALTVGHYLVCLSQARELAAINALFELAGRVSENTTTS